MKQAEKPTTFSNATLCLNFKLYLRLANSLKSQLCSARMELISFSHCADLRIRAHISLKAPSSHVLCSMGRHITRGHMKPTIRFRTIVSEEVGRRAPVREQWLSHCQCLGVDHRGRTSGLNIDVISELRAFEKSQLC